MTDWASRLDPTRPILVTGAAGFIGFFLSEKLLAAGLTVAGIDNLNDYYDPALKDGRLAILRQHERFSFQKVDVADGAAISALFRAHDFAHVVHLAAQAGVRYSIDNPAAYGASNLTGFLNMLEACRAAKVAHLVYASSSSVYGGNRKTPFSTHDPADHPVSLYAATKRANELMAHSYSHLYDMPATGLRFFTVYGPWGRPDMAYFKFAERIVAGQPIQIYNHGNMERDFTFVDDIVEGVARLIPHAPAANPDYDRLSPDPAASWAPHRVYNIGNRRKEKLGEMISLIEQALGQEAVKEYLPMQPGDVVETWADIDDLETEIGFSPDTPLAEGIDRFARWYDGYRRS